MARAAAPPPPPPVFLAPQTHAKSLPPKPPVRAATAEVRAQVPDRSSLLGAIQAGKALKKVEMKEVNWVMCVTVSCSRNCGLESGNLEMRLNCHFCADLFISYQNFSTSAPDTLFHLRPSTSTHLLYDLTMVLRLYVVVSRLVH